MSTCVFSGLGIDETTIDAAIKLNVDAALLEDIQSGDITAELIPCNKTIKARVITRETAVLCGARWVNQVFSTLDNQFSTNTHIRWLASDGELLPANAPIFEIFGNARVLMTGERTALNLLQTLSATATTTRKYVEKFKGTPITLLDTRKTLPGLRIAQKYAVAVGGATNHRIGLWDAFLIKENHIAACGSITNAIKQARKIAPEKPVQVEVENHSELNEAIAQKADIIMLDNFSRQDTVKILSTPTPHSVFEVSGNVDLNNFEAIPSCQNYRVSIGALTKNLQAIDLSFRVIE